MEYKITEKIRRQASLIVLVIDDFSGKIVNQAGIQVEIEGEKKPIRKAEGYYVFLNLKSPQVVLTIQGSHYHTESRTVDVTGLRAAEPIIKIRIKPNWYYPFPKGVTCIQGKGLPGCEVRFLCEGTQKFYRLLYDYDRKKSEGISIYNPEEDDLEGKLFQIQDKEESRKELIFLSGRMDTGEDTYAMELPLKNDYKKVGTKILPVFSARTDEKGEFFLPLSNFSEAAPECRCEMTGENPVTKTIRLEAGRINYFDF